MLTRSARLVVLAIAFILLGWTIYEQIYEISWAITFGIAFLIWSYFKQGTVVLAAKEYHNKNYEKAEKLLKEVPDPDRLSRKRRGFYEFIYGNVELQKNNYAEAEKHFQIATKFPLRTERDKAFLHVHLANLNLRKKDFERAQAYLDKVKSFDTSSRVQAIVKNIQLEIKKNKSIERSIN